MIDGIRRRFRPWFIVWITLMWCLLMGEFSWANFISGLLVGSLIVFGLPLPAMPIAGLQVHWWALLRYMVSWVRDLLVASVKVAWLALRPAGPPKSAIVRVPMRVSNELVLSFATSLYNLQPGGAVSDIDIATTIASTPGPKIAAIASPNRIAGNDSSMSISRMSNPSTRR